MIISAKFLHLIFHELGSIEYTIIVIISLET